MNSANTTGHLQLYARFVKYVAPYKIRVAACGLLILFTTITSLSIPLFSMVIIDKILIPQQPQLLNIIGIALLAAVVGNGVVGFLQSVIFIRFKYRVLHSIRMELFRKIQSLDFDYFIKHQKGYIVSRIHQDAGRLGTLMSNLLFRINVNILMLIIGLVIMFFFHVWLTLFIIAIMPFYFVALTFLARKHRQINLKLLENHGQFQAKLQESIEGVRLTRALGTGKTEEKKYKLYLDRFYASFVNLDIWASFSQLMKVFISSGVVAVILWYGGNQVILGKLSIGKLAAFSSFVGIVFGPLESIYDIVLNLQVSNAALARIFEILDLQPRVKEADPPIEVERVQGNIVFRNVLFRYEKNGFALHRINLTVHQGEKLGVVGRTGAGKTTLINLLLRFYDPIEGDITMGDNALKLYSFDCLRKNIAVVLQDLFFFEGTIADAIALGAAGANREEVEDAARMAQLHDRIVQLPQGYDTLIGEGGVKLSAGEKQRLSIARAILKNSPILILDEATSSIDSESEAAIDRALHHLLKDKTTLVIAHRLSTLLNTDRVIFLDNGTIKDSGSPQELLHRNPDFRLLFKAQLDCYSKNDLNVTVGKMIDV
jgi:ABC-type multidrug transport system fused ATPase/permease subunit